MATAADEGMAKQNNHAQHENEGLQPGGTIKSDQLHDLILVMLRKNPNPESGIQKAMKLLANLNEDFFQIRKKIQERQFDESQAYHQLCRLEYRENCFRSRWTENGEKLASLKRNLDKLTFANNAYKKRVIKTEEKINIHNLYVQMHHGTNNMVMEKKLLNEVNAGQKKLQDHCDSDLSVVEKINDQIRKLRWKIRRNCFIQKPAMMVDEKHVLQEINELIWARDTAFANAPVKGKIWNSIPSKNAIKQQIKLMEKASSDEDRKEHFQLRARIVAVKREINAAKKDIGSLKRQLLDVRRKKGKAYKVILKLIKTNQDLLQAQLKKST